LYLIFLNRRALAKLQQTYAFKTKEEVQLPAGSHFVGNQSMNMMQMSAAYWQIEKKTLPSAGQA